MTIQLYADGTLVTKDRSGTNYSQVKLEDLGLSQDMLSGNTDIELLIVQGDGKEVRATLNTNILDNDKGSQTKESVIEKKKDTPAAAGVAKKESGTHVNELRPYKCSMCPRTFKFYRTFRCHEIVHSKAEIFTCHLCKRVFARETNLASHLELHQKKAAMGISEVQERMRDKQLGVSRLKTSVELKCETCGKVCDDILSLKFHVKEIHNEELVDACKFCDKRFNSEGLLQKHMLVHMGPFFCCDKVFHERNQYISHLQGSHPTKLYTCSVCSKVMISKSDFTSHVKYVHEDDSVEVRQSLLDSLYDAECIECGKKMMKNQLVWHMKDVHGDDDIKCLYCDFVCNMDYKLKKHLKIEHEKDGSNCEQCEREFSTFEEYVSHIRIEHAGPYSCSECDLNHETRSKMEKHQFDEHGINFFCRKCDKKYAHSWELRQHFSEHESSVQTLLCEECGKGFEIKPQLKEHLVKDHYSGNLKLMLKDHPDMKSVPNICVCPICGEFDFKSKTSFARHISDVHFSGSYEAASKALPFMKQYPSPQEPVKCHTCGKTFSHMVYLNMHIKSHLNPKKKKKKDPARNHIDDPSDDEDKVDFTNIEPRESEKTHECPKCKGCFARKAALEKHIKERHSKDYVKKALKKLEKEESERAQAEEEEEVKKSPRKLPRKYICRECEEVCKSKQALLNHMAEEHKNANERIGEDGKEFDIQTRTCNICKKTFGKLSNTRRHMLAVHQIVLPDNEKKAKTETLSEENEDEVEKSVSKKGGKTKPESDEMKDIESKSDVTVPKKRGRKKKVVKEAENTSIDKSDPDVTDDITTFLGRNFNLEKKTASPCNIESVKKKVHKCKKCGVAFSREATLKKHESFHDTDVFDDSKMDVDGENIDDLQVAIYSCPTCGNTYQTGGGLVFHSRNKHPEVDEELVLDHIEEVDKQLKIVASSEDKPATVKSGKRKLSLGEESTSPAKKRVKTDQQGTKSFACLYCQAVYKSFQGVMKHELEAHPQTTTVVYTEPPKQYSLSGRKITKSTKRNEQWQCSICNKYFDVETSLRRHVIMAHAEKLSPSKKTGTADEHKCPKCQKAFDQEGKLRRHMIMKHKERLESVTDLKKETGTTDSPSSSMKYECDVCGENFSVHSTLRHHLISVHDENDDPVHEKKESKTCSECLMEFSSPLNLKCHMRKHTGEMPYRCSVCQEKFIRKHSLEIHLKSKHPKELATKVGCKVCSLLFDTERGMKKHKVTHKKKMEDTVRGSLQHTCEDCKKVFKWKKNLLAHRSFFHEQDRTEEMKKDTKVQNLQGSKAQGGLDCKYCGRMFEKASGLRMHVLAAHERAGSAGEAHFFCDICKKGFTSKAKLLHHMLCHTSVMPFKCNRCGASFKHEHRLNMHKCDKEQVLKPSAGRKRHGFESGKTFSCLLCGKKFVKLWHVNAHKREVHKDWYLGVKLAKKKRAKAVASATVTRRHSATINSDESEETKTGVSNKVSQKKLASEVKPKRPRGRPRIYFKEKEKDSAETDETKGKPKIRSKSVAEVDEKPKGKKNSKVKPRVSLTPGAENASSRTKAESKAGKKSGKLLSTKKGTAAQFKIKSKLVEKSKLIAKMKNKTNTGKITSKMGLAKVANKLGPKSSKVGKAAKSAADTLAPPHRRPVPCPICSKVLSKKQHLKVHIRNVHKTDPETVIVNVPTKRVKCLYCNDCSKMYWSQAQYDAHMKDKHPEKVELGELQVIKQEVLSPPRETLGEDAGQGFETVQHKCEFCNSIFWTKTNFDRHIVKYHPDHINEYGISSEILAQSKPEIEMVDDTQDPANILSVEVYQNIACQKLASSPVVMIEKMSDNFAEHDQLSKEKPNMEVSEENDKDLKTGYKELPGVDLIDNDNDSNVRDEQDNINDTQTVLKQTSLSFHDEKDKDEITDTCISASKVHAESGAETLERQEISNTGPEVKETDIDQSRTENHNLDEVQKEAMEIEMEYDEDIVPIDIGNKPENVMVTENMDIDDDSQINAEDLSVKLVAMPQEVKCEETRNDVLDDKTENVTGLDYLKKENAKQSSVNLDEYVMMENTEQSPERSFGIADTRENVHKVNDKVVNTGSEPFNTYALDKDSSDIQKKVSSNTVVDSEQNIYEDASEKKVIEQLPVGDVLDLGNDTVIESSVNELGNADYLKDSLSGSEVKLAKAEHLSYKCTELSNNDCNVSEVKGSNLGPSESGTEELCENIENVDSSALDSKLENQGNVLDTDVGKQQGDRQNQGSIVDADDH